MNVNMPVVGLVAVLSSFVLYWRVAENLLLRVLTFQAGLLQASLNRGERSQQLAIGFVRSPLAAWVHTFTRPRYWMAAKFYTLRTTERTRQRESFVAAFGGLAPEPIDAAMQRLVTGQLIKLATKIDDEHRQLLMLADIEREFGKSAAPIAAPIQLQMDLAQIVFDHARSAAEYFGYDVVETWQENVDQIDDFLASATG